MRDRMTWLAALLVAACTVAAPPLRAEDEAPTDPTRGHWDGFLDPLRDFEDDLENGQKTLEDNTQVHIGAGITKSYMWNFNDPANDLNTLHSLDPDHDSPELDFAQLSVARPSDGWIPGFTLKMDAGRAAKRIKPDYDGNGALNVGDTFEKSSFDVQDAYLTWTVPEGAPLEGLSFKGGKFVTLLGAEVIEPWANPNFSRSFLFGLAIPFTHTGGLVSYPITESVSVTAGPVIGWDNFKDNNDAVSWMGNVTWVANDHLTFATNGIWGPEQRSRSGQKRGVVDLVATIKPTDRLTFLLNYDWGHEDEVVNADRPATWQGFSGILNYAFTDRCSAALRGEWFEDSDGVRTGVRQTLWEGTVSAKYLITEHLWWRLEYRHDESDEGVFLADDDKLLAGQDILGFEFTYLFN